MPRSPGPDISPSTLVKFPGASAFGPAGDPESPLPPPISPLVALSDVWPVETCIYKDYIVNRESGEVVILAMSRPMSSEEIRPFQGWTPSGIRASELADAAPVRSLVSLIIASWLRDADAPLDIFKNLSAASATWACTRHKVLWMFIDKDDDWIIPRPEPRPSVGARDSGEIDPWGLIPEYLDTSPKKESVIGWLVLSTVVPLLDMGSCTPIVDFDPAAEESNDHELAPLPLRIEDLPGV